MFRYEGFDYSLDQVTDAAGKKGLSVDEYVDQFGLETVEVTDEIQTTPTEGKTSDVATVDGAVTSGPDTASECTGSDQVDTSGDLQPKKVGRPNARTRAAQRAATIEQQVDNNETTEPEVNYEELIDTVDYLDLFQDLSKDTGATKFTKKEADGGVKNWLKKYYYLFTENINLGNDIGVVDREGASDDVVDMYYTQAMEEGDLSMEQAANLSKKFIIEFAKLVTLVICKNQKKEV